MMFAAGATLVSGFNAGSMPARNSVAARSAVTMQVSEALVAQPVALAKVRTAFPPFSLSAPSATRQPAVARSLWHKAPWAGSWVERQDVSQAIAGYQHHLPTPTRAWRAPIDSDSLAALLSSSLNPTGCR